MAIDVELDKLWEQKRKIDSLIEARATIQNCMWTIDECRARVEAIVAEKGFIDHPVEVQTAITASLKVVADASAAFKEKSVADTMEWAGK